MTVTELASPNFKPESAEDAFAAIPAARAALENVDVIEYIGTTHILQHNGADVSHELRSIATIVWDKVESFHDFFPNSEAFKAFITPLIPYIASPAAPKLFDPAPGYASSEHIWKELVSHIYLGQFGEKKTQVLEAWKKALGEIGSGEGKDWFGYGIEADEGTWVGVLAGESVEGGLSAERVQELGVVERWIVKRMT
ncbi:hypothetical protein BCR34DRAFT_205453 [Clohesyomyces aquaticus]|uniref:Uncharacterized protein n=1 Tax=Clohesyomyces aquaticus TaxID=1231657 RepID=A0A1Y1YA51_9PLEO|nr:hypothetical protein BCR34DRAFT_205453 [Clohesyomyces aquaticus]